MAAAPPLSIEWPNFVVHPVSDVKYFTAPSLAQTFGTLVRIALVLLFACCPWVVADDAKNSTDEGLALARAIYDRADGKDVTSRVIMLLEKEGQEPKTRLLYVYAKQVGPKERWSLMRFIKPEDVDKTGLLTKDYAGDNSDQWLYLPALKRVRRIASSRNGGRFVGSDFFYEDLKDREPDMDHHRIIGTDKVGGVPCTLLESTPADKKNSVYGKRLSCIHNGLKLPLRVDFYGPGSNEPYKRLQASKIKKIQGYWTIFESKMENLESGHTTRLVTTDIVYDQNIPEELFSQRGLSDDSRELAFRPKQQD